MNEFDFMAVLTNPTFWLHLVIVTTSTTCLIIATLLPLLSAFLFLLFAPLTMLLDLARPREDKRESLAERVLSLGIFPFYSALIWTLFLPLFGLLESTFPPSYKAELFHKLVLSSFVSHFGAIFYSISFLLFVIFGVYASYRFQRSLWKISALLALKQVKPLLISLGLFTVATVLSVYLR